MIDTRIVNGFLDAGKTTYIQDSILNDFFYKRGSTLILCFEQGEAEYDGEKLQEKNTQIAYYDGKQDITQFCVECIEKYRPDRVYTEMNAMIQGLRKKLPDQLHVTSTVTLIDWSTLGVYFANFRQMINNMVSESVQVTFRGCPSKELLAPYSEAFRTMNHRASYLRQDPMGYHEKAFDLFLPFSLEEKEITVAEKEYLPFWLDAAEHPEHYEGKQITFTDPLVMRKFAADEPWSAGRVVMTCCMADLQFMSFELADAPFVPAGGWITLKAKAEIAAGEFGRTKLRLIPLAASQAQPPKELLLSPLTP